MRSAVWQDSVGVYHYEVVPGAEPGDKMIPAGEVRDWDVEAVAGQKMGVVGQNCVYPFPGVDRHRDQTPLVSFLNASISKGQICVIIMTLLWQLLR